MSNILIKMKKTKNIRQKRYLYSRIISSQKLQLNTKYFTTSLKFSAETLKSLKLNVPKRIISFELKG